MLLSYIMHPLKERTKFDRTLLYSKTNKLWGGALGSAHLEAEFGICVLPGR